ncbi:MAG: glucose-6-phosphate isomerase [Bdellovibrionaceae bacterium]|nr:glucose-6-phosphate isomerase [Pseudobdellovibrionaceae bacterium]
MIEISQARFDTPADLLQQCRDSLDRSFAKKGSGFPELPAREALWTEAEKIGRELRQHYEHLVVIGTGGSSLGGQVIAAQRPGSRLRFLENVDALAVSRVMHGLDAKRTAFVMISKSGGTIETLAGIDYLREFLARQGIDLKKQSHALTESPDNSLGRWAQQNKVPLMIIPRDVGGRYSVLSPVGMIPAAFDGADVKSFRAGAAWALEQKDLVANLMAQSVLSFERQEWITYFWIYDSLARVLGCWIQQLWGESLGKKTGFDGQPARRASTPMAGLGTVDQHSMLQQLADNVVRDKLIVFVRSKEAEGGNQPLQQPEFLECDSLRGHSIGELLKAEAIATEEALHRQSVSTLTLTVDSFDDRALGAFFMTLQLWVGALGEHLGLDPYDQPGVELGKILTKEYLKKR